jgi:endonuclease YncB( thermonuclease family)
MPMTLRKISLACLVLLWPAIGHAVEISGVPKIREADQIQIGSTRIRLGGIDAPSTDQLCLNTQGERWACGVAARDELIKHVGTRSWTCQTRTTDRRGRTVARCQVDGEDIQKWLATNGWALALRSPLLLRQSWSVEGASMPPRRMRVLPIWIWSASRIFGTPLISTAWPATGHSRTRQASEILRSVIGIPGEAVRTLPLRLCGQKALRASGRGRARFST